MDAIAQMQEWIDKTKALEKELSSLEKEVRQLADKEADIRERRSSLQQEISEHEQAITALQQKDANVKTKLLDVLLEDNVSEERTLKQRRKQIASDIEQHQTDIRGLREQLDALEDTEKEAAEVAARLDALEWGYAFGFGTELRNALVQNELKLKSRQSTTKRQLPKYSKDVYEEARAAADTDYAARQERGRMSEVEHANFQKRQQEQTNNDVAAYKEFVGVSAYGGSRRMEPDSRDFSS